MIVWLLLWRNTTIIFTNFYLDRKVLIFLRNNSDCKDKDLYKTRKQYTVIESRMRNISWLVSCFSKIKKPNKHCSENLSVIAGVCILTQLLLPWELCFIDFDNNKLARGMTIIQRTIVPCWNNAIGLGNIVCHTKSKKKWWKRQPICQWQTFHQQEKAIKHDGCKRCFEQWWAYSYLIPVTTKKIHSAVWDSERFILIDGRPLHMIKLVGAIRNFCVKIKHVQIMGLGWCKSPKFPKLHHW